MAESAAEGRAPSGRRWVAGAVGLAALSLLASGALLAARTLDEPVLGALRRARRAEVADLATGPRTPGEVVLASGRIHAPHPLTMPGHGERVAYGRLVVSVLRTWYEAGKRKTRPVDLYRWERTARDVALVDEAGRALPLEGLQGERCLLFASPPPDALEVEPLQPGDRFSQAVRVRYGDVQLVDRSTRVTAPELSVRALPDDAPVTVIATLTASGARDPWVLAGPPRAALRRLVLQRSWPAAALLLGGVVLAAIAVSLGARGIRRRAAR